MNLKQRSFIYYLGFLNTIQKLWENKMHILITTILFLLLISCANPPTDSQYGMSDKQAIEAVSSVLTNLQIDSIAITANVKAIVFYKRDTINPYVTSNFYLDVYNIQSLDSSSSIYDSKPVCVGNWISDSNYLTRRMDINMYSDSIRFAVITYDIIPIDTLRSVLRYMSDSTFCNFMGCSRVPLDSMRSMSWYHKKDTIIIEMTQPHGNYSGTAWAFKVFDGIVELWSRARWIE